MGRDIIVGGLYGHMNIDHFMLQDKKHIDLVLADGDVSDSATIRTLMDEELSIESANDYLEELRADWSGLPNPNVAFQDDDNAEILKKKHKKKKGKKSKKERALKKIGGPWGERFQVTHVSPSIVPNFFPTLRVMEYNISGLDLSATWASAHASDQAQEAKEAQKSGPNRSIPACKKLTTWARLLSTAFDTIGLHSIFCQFDLHQS